MKGRCTKFVLKPSHFYYLHSTVFIAFVVLTFSSGLGKDLRCPLNLEPNELAPYPYDSTRYYRCLSSGLLQVASCPTGQTFSLIQLKCTDFDYGHGEIDPAAPAPKTSTSPDRINCSHGGEEDAPNSKDTGIRNECECPETTPCPVITPCPVVSNIRQCFTKGKSSF